MLAVLIAAALVGTPGADSGVPTCSPGAWRLEGAPTKAVEGAAYMSEWTVTLEGVAACVQATRSVCVEVQGHFDEVAFDGPTIRAFGSVAAAQQARARGRSTSVLQKLRELGVPDTLLREAYPIAASTFRGVTVNLKNDCAAAIAPAEVAGLVKEATDGLLVPESKVLATAVATQLERIEAERQRAAPPPPPPAPWNVVPEAGVTLSLVGFPTSDDNSRSLAPLLHGGVFVAHVGYYGRASLGLLLGSAREQRLGAELALGAGIERDFWQVGARLSGRMTTPGLSDPWLDRSWDVGVEGAECLWQVTSFDVCLYQVLAPFGSHLRRGEVNGGAVERIPERSSYVVRFDAGVVVR